MKTRVFYYIVTLLLFTISCKKSTYLDASPNDNFVVLATLNDYQAVLDNAQVMNSNAPVLGELGTDEYFVLSSKLSTLPAAFQSLYAWDDNMWTNPLFFHDWDYCYAGVYYANTVLDGLDKMNRVSSDSAYNSIKGSALFFRSWFFYQAAQIFAPQYNQSTASSDLGIALKMHSDINESLHRATVQQTYDRIIGDLMIAKDLLPIDASLKKRPSKPAAYALLARTYLVMGQYDSAYKYADACLGLYSTLLDYNTLSTTAFIPMPQPEQNREIIFNSVITSKGNNLLSPGVGNADSTLYNSYQANDIRKLVFFKTIGAYKAFLGNYSSQIYGWAGIAVDEMYLTRAECYARKGNLTAAMNDLNTLLIKRWKKDPVTGLTTYANQTAVDANDALNKILTERRKELAFRGTSWSDLRRLNKEGANITVTRVINGTIYTLAPNSLHYTFLIPPTVMDYHQDWRQNPR